MDNILDKMLEELNAEIPKTVEEAEEMIKKNDLQYAAVIAAANINALIAILINKGIITQEEFLTWYNASEKTYLRAAAEKVMKVFEDDEDDK